MGTRRARHETGGVLKRIERACIASIRKLECNALMAFLADTRTKMPEVAEKAV